MTVALTKIQIIQFDIELENVKSTQLCIPSSLLQSYLTFFHMDWKKVHHSYEVVNSSKFLYSSKILYSDIWKISEAAVIFLDFYFWSFYF